MTSNGRQPTISKFFAPRGPKGTSISNTKIKTDAQSPPKKKCKITEIDFSPPLKRSQSSSSSETSPKRCKVNGADKIDNSVSPKSNQTNGCSTSPNLGGKSKLEAFRFRNDKSNKDESINASPIKSSTAVKGKGFVVPKGDKLTPLESQVVAIKQKHSDTLLFVECGYKYRFFADDAEIAAKELNIVAHLDHNFQTASIPVHRLHVHVRRLVAKGYKVGVVKQTETAALKAVGSNKSTVFSRKLTALYTRATLIGEDISPAGLDDLNEVTESTTTSSLMVLLETEPSSGKDKVGVVIVSIQPTTGEVGYDLFDDTLARSALWGRLEQIQPVEVIVSEKVPEITRKAITAVMTRHDDCIRIESLPEEVFEYSSCLHALCQLYEGREEKIRHMSDLPHPVISCLGATLHYLKEFKLERILTMASDITKLSSSKEFMRLPGPTLRNLEVVVNSSDGEEKGSLFWVLNQTSTKFGARVLRNWLLCPLLDIEKIEERQEMIEEIMTSDAMPINTLKESLQKLPDFEKSLTTIFYKKCSPYEFWLTASGLSRVQRQLSSICGSNLPELVHTQSLVRLITTIVDKLGDIHQFPENIELASAKENKKVSLFKDWSEFEDVIERRKEIKSVENELQEQRPQIARILDSPSFAYSIISGSEYLIEVKNNKLKFVPSSWTKINSTKACCRFRSKEVEKLFTKLQQLREQLQADCQQAWLLVLERFSEQYQDYREAVKCIGVIDALLSLAKVAQLNGYCRPQLINSDEAHVQIIKGKHPIVQQLKGSEQFVANDTNLMTNGERVMLVTGPNMGGKSCYMRQVALIVLMAQVGSYVPAESAKISVLDGIFTRMGATDEIFSGKSSLMVEIGETADIINVASRKSLVILDELGRGTSTHDGVAIATAVLDFFLKQIKCLTIFVTHYLTLSQFGNLYPENVGNHHMSFIVNEDSSDDTDVDVITFLYQLTAGNAGQSYGLNVARLANVPHSVLKNAAQMSKMLRRRVDKRRIAKESFKKIFSGSPPSGDDLSSIISCLND